MIEYMTHTSRGIRNNNPLNIRRGHNWKGLRPTQTDAAFCQFTSIEWGIRAAVLILASYARKHVRTIEEIITRWAPPSENNTRRYIQMVCDTTGWPPSRVVPVNSETDTTKFLQAMAAVETGVTIRMELLRAGYRLANVQQCLVKSQPCSEDHQQGAAASPDS